MAIGCLLHIGYAIGLIVYRNVERASLVRLSRNEMAWFIRGVISGGFIAPVLLIPGLTGMPSSGASLLLNAEGVFTELLARSAFKENFEYRIAGGMIAIMAGALILSWPADARCAGLRPAKQHNAEYGDDVR